MKRVAGLFVVFLLAGSTAGQAERICEVEDRSDNMKDGETVTISGQIENSYGRDADGDYTYTIVDSCGEAAVGWSQPIDCRGRLTITGQYKLYVSLELFGQIAVWATRVRCH